jgi:prefoldin subunit 5
MAGTGMMLPLTQSLYVEGELADAENVLVDIGTGYYLQVRHVSVSSTPCRCQTYALHIVY